MDEEDLVIVPVPALVAVLLNRERAKGEPLIEAEVLEIRDAAECVAMPRDVAAQVAAERGYDDIRPDHVWEDWGTIRAGLQG